MSALSDDKRIVARLHGASDMVNALRELEMHLVSTSSGIRMPTLIESVVVPLLRTCADIFLNGNQSIDVASAWVYLGLLRTHLLKPKSATVDPVAKRQLVCTLLFGKLQRIASEQEARQDRTDASTDNVQNLKKRGSVTAARLAKASQQLSFRPSTSYYNAVATRIVTFHDSFMGTSKVLGILNALKTFSSGALDLEDSWQQSTMHLFDSSSKLENIHYRNGYADIVVPYECAVYAVKHGLRMAAHLKASPTNFAPQITVLSSFPSTCAGAKTASEALSSIVDSCPLRARKDVLLASLVSLASVANERALTGEEYRAFHDVSLKLLRHWRHTEEKRLEELEKAGMSYTLKSKTETLTTETTDELDEAEYRKMFPDHHSAFQVQFDDEDGYQTREEADATGKDGSADGDYHENAHNLSDADLIFSAATFLSALKSSTPGSNASAEGARQRLAYKYRCLEYFLNESTVAEGVSPSSLGGHIATVSTYATDCTPSAIRVDDVAESAKRSIYQHAYVKEASRCLTPLNALKRRVLELLDQWPEKCDVAANFVCS